MKNFCITLILALLIMPVATQAKPSSYDGDWDVTLSCPDSPDGHARGYTFKFPAEVKDGVLHGERGTKGAPGWLQLDGPIKPDGAASLIAEGLTSRPAYAINNVQTGTHFKHEVTAHFDKDMGIGSWITIRTCNFTFEKEK